MRAAIKKEIEIDRIFLCQNFLFDMQILHIRLDSKITLNSASKLNSNEYKTNAS